MSKPRKYWYGFIQTYLRRYEKLDRHKLKEDEAARAIDEALAELVMLNDGDERKQLLQMVFFKGTHTIPGAALRMHISEHTAYRWVSQFTYSVGNKMGFE